MSKKLSSSQKGKSPIEVLVARYGFWGTMVTAFLGLAGVILTAYVGYAGIKAQLEIPIHATQTAEAKLATQIVEAKLATQTVEAKLATLIAPISTQLIPPTLSAENLVEVVFSFPATAYKPATVRITTESGLTAFSFEAQPGTTQKVVLPPGNYKYEVITESMLLPTGEAYASPIITTESFTLKQGSPAEVILHQ